MLFTLTLALVKLNFSVVSSYVFHGSKKIGEFEIGSEMKKITLAKVEKLAILTAKEENERLIQCHVCNIHLCIFSTFPVSRAIKL